jgi:DNA-binding winged helix-turn-helix (wHTH) protein
MPEITKEQRNFTEAPLRLGDFEVNRALRSVRRLSGEELRLRPKAFDVLLYLIDNSQRVVTKRELLESVWADTTVTDDSLVQCIVEIRRLLDDTARDAKYIRNVPKVGYQFVWLPEGMDAPPRVRARRWPWGVAAVSLAVAAVGWYAANSAPRPALVAHWRLDGAAAPEGGGARGGLERGSSVWIPGVAGQAYAPGSLRSSLGGSGGDFPSGNSARSITAWIKADQTLHDSATIFQYGNASEDPPGQSAHLSLTPDGRLMFGTSWATGLPRLSGGPALTDGRWHMIAATYSGGPDNRAALFVDGEPVSRLAFAPGLATSDASQWRIGASLQSGGAFRGAVDDIRLYRRELDAARIDALHRCTLNEPDLQMQAGRYQFLRIFPNASFRRDNGEIVHPGNDVGGFQLRRMEGECDLSRLRGSAFANDVRIAVEVMAPEGAGGRESQVGPYFRARSAAPGDGVMGGRSAGYWLALWSTGLVQMKCLNPVGIVAYAQLERFDASIFHTIEIEARGDFAEVSVDGKPVLFGDGEKQFRAVPVPSNWTGIGSSDGAVGVAFGAMPHRNGSGGQRVRRLAVAALGAPANQSATSSARP